MQNIFFFAFVSMIISPIILCMIMIARYCVVKCPFTSAFKNQIYIKRLMKFCISIAIISCIFLFSSLFVFHENYIPTELCLALYISFYFTVTTCFIDIFASHNSTDILFINHHNSGNIAESYTKK